MVFEWRSSITFNSSWTQVIKHPGRELFPDSNIQGQCTNFSSVCGFPQVCRGIANLAYKGTHGITCHDYTIISGSTVSVLSWESRVHKCSCRSSRLRSAPVPGEKFQEPGGPREDCLQRAPLPNDLLCLLVTSYGVVEQVRHHVDLLLVQGEATVSVSATKWCEGLVGVERRSVTMSIFSWSRVKPLSASLPPNGAKGWLVLRGGPTLASVSPKGLRRMLTRLSLKLPTGLMKPRKAANLSPERPARMGEKIMEMTMAAPTAMRMGKSGARVARMSPLIMSATAAPAAS